MFSFLLNTCLTYCTTYLVILFSLCCLNPFTIIEAFRGPGTKKVFNICWINVQWLNKCVFNEWCQLFQQRKSYHQHLRVVPLHRSTKSHSVKVSRLQSSLRNTLQMDTGKLDNLDEEYTDGSKLAPLQAPLYPSPEHNTLPACKQASFTLFPFPQVFQNGKNMLGSGRVGFPSSGATFSWKLREEGIPFWEQLIGNIN